MNALDLLIKKNRIGKKNNRHTHCSKNIFLHQEPAINNMFKDHPLYQARISK